MYDVLWSNWCRTKTQLDVHSCKLLIWELGKFSVYAKSSRTLGVRLIQSLDVVMSFLNIRIQA